MDKFSAIIHVNTHKEIEEMRRKRLPQIKFRASRGILRMA